MLQLRMSEWQQISFADEAALVNRSLENDHARLLAGQLAQAGRLEILELRGGLSIKATSYVGRIQLGDLQITIQPKIKLQMLAVLFRYAYSLRDLRLLDHARTDTERNVFQDILIEQLIAEVSELIARGLQRQYRRVDEALTMPKGRMDLQRIAQQGGVITAQIPVIHFPRLENSLLNQVLLSGVLLAVTMTDDLLIRARLRRLAGLLYAQVSGIALDFATLQRVRQQMNRLTAHYEPSITLIELLMQAAGVTLENSDQSMPLPGFLFDMNLFFERLLSRFLNEHLPEWTVHDQYRLRSVMSYSPQHNPRRRQSPIPRPDFVITQGASLVSMLDAKYCDLWEESLRRDMLYQLAIYALSQGRSGSAIILYPAVDAVPQPQVIDIHDPLNHTNTAQVILKPVNLERLSQLLGDRSLAARRERIAFATALVSPLL
jgi:5-methylcytosine-specific restriction enzyme subunit McrC